MADVEDLQYFVGKVCTVITPNINWKFDERQSADYFSGIVEKITPMGILTIHPVTQAKNFYLLSHVTSIHEEQYITKDDPHYDAVVKQYEEDKKPKQQQPVMKTPVVPQDSSPFVDVEALEELARRHKK